MEAIPRFSDHIGVDVPGTALRAADAADGLERQSVDWSVFLCRKPET